MFHHHRPVFASVCSTTLSAPFTLKVEGGGSTSSSNWATPLGFGRTASPTALESEDERSPPSSPVHPFGKDTSIDSVQREQLLHQVSVLTNSIRYLSHKAQAQGLSGDERELLKAQLFALEFHIARTSAPHTQPLATTSISDSRPSSPPAADLASGVAADRHWHHLHDIRDHHLGVNLTSQHKKRAKRTFNRACVHCGTQFTSQWRKGPAGASTLCNACGIRYARRLKKDAKAAAQASTTPKPCDDAGKRSTVYSLLN